MFPPVVRRVHILAAGDILSFLGILAYVRVWVILLVID
jgi:hypothetical protein